MEKSLSQLEKDRVINMDKESRGESNEF